MSVYQPRWLDWSPKEAQPRTDKTDKSQFSPLKPPFVSSVSASPEHFRGDEKGLVASHDDAQTIRKALPSLTAKTDKRCGRTLWEEPDIPAKSPPGSRVVLLEVPDGVPETWVQGVGDLMVMPTHPDWTEDGWKALQEDALRFLHDWAVQAHGLGWGALDLFGGHPIKPTVRFDSLGLVPLLKGRPLLALTEDRAAIEGQWGAGLTFYKRAVRTVEQSLIWELRAKP